jgi:hypothetical protein
VFLQVVVISTYFHFLYGHVIEHIMLEHMKQAQENSFDKFSNGGRLSKATPFRRVIVLQWKVNDKF